MKVTAINTDIPDWLHPHMKHFCDCGAGVMIDDGPIGEDGIMKLTQRWCSNPYCPYHMAEKINKLAKYFGVAGVGPKGAYQDVIAYSMKNHLEAMRLWFRDKPEVYLYQAAELSYVYGLGDVCKDLFGPYSSYEEFFLGCRDIPDVVYENRDYLEECTKYFTIKKSTLSRTVLKIMITGSIHGYSSRDSFLNVINELYKDYFRVSDNKKTIRDTICLVKEPESVDYTKSDIATRNNIPIVSSAEFLAILESMKEEVVNENE